VIASIVSKFFGDRWTYIQLGAIYWVLWALVDQYNARIEATSAAAEIIPVSTEMGHVPDSRIAS